MPDEGQQQQQQQTPDPSQQQQGGGGGDRTFTQSDVDQLIGERLRREREKIGDLDELRRKAGELDKLRDAQKSELEKAVENARREAAAEATTAATKTLNRRLLQAEVKAAAAGKLSNPEDAVALLNMDGFVVSDDGSIDTKPIERAIDQLIKDKPYLAGAGAPPRPGSGDSGARRPANGGVDMNDLLRKAAGRA